MGHTFSLRAYRIRAVKRLWALILLLPIALGKTYLVPIEGEIDPALAVFVEQALARAEREGASGVAFALRAAGLEVWVWNRNPQRALALAEEFGLRAVPLEKAREARLLVNATRVGLEDPSASPLPAELFPEEGAAVDLVYRPLWTRFLREAKAKGLKVQTGLPMLAWQGALAFRLWTGLLPDPSGMEEAARRALGV